MGQSQINWDHEIALALDRHNTEDGSATQPESTISATTTSVTSTTTTVAEPGPRFIERRHVVFQQPPTLSMRSHLFEMVRPNFLRRFIAELDTIDEHTSDEDSGDDDFEHILIQSFNLHQPHLEPAHRSVIDALPCKKWRDTRAKDPAVRESEKCCICIDHYEDDDDVVLLRCKHVMHKRCGKDWFQEHGICPLCRKPIADELCPSTTTREPTASVQNTPPRHHFRPPTRRRRRRRPLPFPFARHR